MNHDTRVVERPEGPRGYRRLGVCSCGWESFPVQVRSIYDATGLRETRERIADHLRWVRAVELGRQCVTCHGTGDRSGSPDLACRDCFGTGIAPDYQEKK